MLSRRTLIKVTSAIGALGSAPAAFAARITRTVKEDGTVTSINSRRRRFEIVSSDYDYGEEFGILTNRRSTRFFTKQGNQGTLEPASFPDLEEGQKVEVTGRLQGGRNSQQRAEGLGRLEGGQSSQTIMAKRVIIILPDYGSV